MAQYFFHIDGDHPHLDEVGEDHLHDASAWQAALRLIRDVEGKLQPGQAWLLEVHEDKNPVYVISIKTHRKQKARRA